MAKWWWLAVGGSVALLGCARPEPSPGGKAGAVRVKVVRVQPQRLELKITAVGTLEPEHKVVVAAQAEGVVHRLEVREGDRVAAGQMVVQLDDRELVAQLQEAEARLAEAQGQWQRARNLVGEGLITAAEADAAWAAFRVAQARVEALRTRLSFTRIAAPAAGVVTARFVEVGSLVSARSPVLELAVGRTVLRVPVSELDVVKLQAGDRAKVKVDALGEQAFPARIARIFPAADPTSRQVTVELVLEELPEAVRPGFLARAELVVGVLPSALLIPEGALMRGSAVPTFVYVVEGQQARVRPVAVSLRQGGLAVVTEGLKAGEAVVVEGTSLLRDNAPVQVEGES